VALHQVRAQDSGMTKMHRSLNFKETSGLRGTVSKREPSNWAFHDVREDSRKGLKFEAPCNFTKEIRASVCITQSMPPAMILSSGLCSELYARSLNSVVLLSVEIGGILEVSSYAINGVNENIEMRFFADSISQHLDLNADLLVLAYR
jgi:hypothetical protein